MRESTVEAHLRKKATAAGALVRKMFWPGHRGAPDRLVIWPGFRLGAPIPGPEAQDYVAAVTRKIAAEMPGTAVIHFIELKAPGKKPDPHQEREHEKLRAMGCAVYTFDSIEAVDEYIARRTQ
jgi:hypothetical protein